MSEEKLLSIRVLLEAILNYEYTDFDDDIEKAIAVIDSELNKENV